jgi:23S rRNA maturation-related 3'-5' exoribonuclease YhaM
MQNELNYIKNETIKNNIEIILNSLPDYFWEIPASSTGKYHPEFSLGREGLIRHTKAAVKIAYDLLQLEQYKNLFEDYMQDLIIGALIIHDGLKYGFDYNVYNFFEHPNYIANYIEELFNKNQLTLSNDEVYLLKGLVASHMGEWNTNKYSNVILPKPLTEAEKFVHLCDYLSSRKYLNIKFENGEIVK